MAQREGRYETKSDQDSLEDLSKKLTNDLRKNIRDLASSPHTYRCMSLVM
jgi:hypothetical protein